MFLLTYVTKLSEIEKLGYTNPKMNFISFLFLSFKWYFSFTYNRSNTKILHVTLFTIKTMIKQLVIFLHSDLNKNKIKNNKWASI